MRTTPLTVATLAAALLLTACDDNGGSTAKDGKNTKDSSACGLGAVTVQVGPASVAPSVGDTGQVPVTVTNRDAKCTLDDFPGVVLRSGSTDTNLAPEKGAKAQKLTLAKNDAVTFTITYQRGRKGDPLSVDADKMLISLPGSTATRSFTWSYGPVASKGEVSNVIASVSAFQQAGD